MVMKQMKVPQLAVVLGMGALHGGMRRRRRGGADRSAASGSC